MKKRIKEYWYLIKNVLCYPLNLFKGNRISFSGRLHGGILNRSKVGRHTYIGPYTVINHTIIGNYCSIAPGVQIGGMEHSLHWYATSTALSNRCIGTNKTYIGHNVWIAAGAIIKQGVRIGDGAVIGAGAFVNKDIPANAVAVGTPAKVIRQRLNHEMLATIAVAGLWEMEPRQIKRIIGE